MSLADVTFSCMSPGFPDRLDKVAALRCLPVFLKLVILPVCRPSTLTVLKLWKRLMLCGGGVVSMGNCRKCFMSKWGWIMVGVRKNVGTAGPARFMPPAHRDSGGLIYMLSCVKPY